MSASVACVQAQQEPTFPSVSFICDIEELVVSNPSVGDMKPILEVSDKWFVGLGSCEGLEGKHIDHCMEAQSGETNSRNEFSYIGSVDEDLIEFKVGVGAMYGDDLSVTTFDGISMLLDTKKRTLMFGGETSSLSPEIQKRNNQYSGFSGFGTCTAIKGDLIGAA